MGGELNTEGDRGWGVETALFFIYARISCICQHIQTKSERLFVGSGLETPNLNDGRVSNPIGNKAVESGEPCLADSPAAEDCAVTPETTTL